MWNRPSLTAARLFMNGRSQAIRPPKEFRVASAEFFLKKTSGGFTVIERDPGEVFEAGGRALADDFMSKRVPPPLEMTCLLDPDTLIFMVRGLKIVTPKNEPHRERLRAAGKVAAHCRRRQLLGHGQQGGKIRCRLGNPASGFTADGG